MTTPDDTTEPLAGIDLQAWQPPAPPAGQVDAILGRVRDTTRTDVASAVEVDAVPPAERPTPRRWGVIGIVVAAVAAAVIAVAVWPAGDAAGPDSGGSTVVTVGSLTRQIEALEVERMVLLARLVDRQSVDDVRARLAEVDGQIAELERIVSGLRDGSGSALRAVATVGDALARCREYRDAEDWVSVLECAKRLPTGQPEVAGLTEQARREVSAKQDLDDLTTAARNKDYQAVVGALREIPADSIYFERARTLHEQVRDDFIQDEVVKAKAAANRHDCKAVENRANQIAKTWPEAADAVRAVQCGGDGTGIDRDGSSAGNCDAVALLDEARAAGTANRWSKMLAKAEASNACSPSKVARQLALLAACSLGNKPAALRYAKEFANNNGMLQLCVTTVDWGALDAAPAALDVPAACDAAALLQEAKDAGGANQWSKMFTKAEASSKCSPSKTARLLALLAACQLGNRDKALKYWKEFENNSGMRQRCISVIK